MLIGSSRSLSNFSGIMTPNAVPNWSKTLDTEVASLNKLFGIRPYFTFFDDRPENAFATEERLNPDYPDGTVLLGKNLMNDIYENYKIDAEFIIIGILAHEWAHIKQMKLKSLRDWIVQDELSADFLSGWYLGNRGYYNRQEVIAKYFGTLGNMKFQDPHHHGTPTQRAGVLGLGLSSANERMDTKLLQSSYVSE